MDWIQIISLFLANATLIFWFRAESRADWRHMDTKMEGFRTETNTKLEVFRTETTAILNAIREDMKDFHGRLCAIEEKNKKHD